MHKRRSPLDAYLWLRDLFSSRAARDGGVIRRKARDIDRFVGWHVVFQRKGPEIFKRFR
ncbi:hypothetical protein [Shimia sp. FJ5]|uniref:hypothetical protein n=1 Tax=Shimia sp. FJ5 TaxID=3079054 RepID=UPI00293DD86D|nr:hypothetical protein [Shimia sp. FJ5]MDV4144453.1 hypothetical protein [Shimia sp. FJ5]